MEMVWVLFLINFCDQGHVNQPRFFYPSAPDRNNEFIMHPHCWDQNLEDFLHIEEIGNILFP